MYLQHKLYKQKNINPHNSALSFSLTQELRCNTSTIPRLVLVYFCQNPKLLGALEPKSKVAVHRITPHDK